LNNNAIVIDSQTAIALGKYMHGEALQAGERAMINRLVTMGDIELVMPDGAVAEIRGRQLTWKNTPVRKGMPTTVDRNDPAYQSLLQELETNNVGQAKGGVDRQIVADTFFAQTEPGVTPTLTTHDAGIYRNLARMAGIDPAKVGKSISEAYPNGFDVTIDGRTIHVVPLPRK
jgi:hypothetical protein